ncbi:amidase [Rhizobiaceae bacterium]|nr:amidase [Rhizobiaceae bacterium]
MNPLDLPVLELRDRIAAGAVRVPEVATAANARIAERDGDIGAFAFHDPGFVTAQAEALERHRIAGRPLGRLHGVPVALKDIIDTSFMPTANGTSIDAGRKPERDAAIVTALKREGALIVGKTVTTELAFLAPSITRNPAAPGRTPGGSSAGSAAAVAASMVPLAVGSQTGGSTIRPAAFCGAVGYKPTFGAIPRTGIVHQSQTLDTVGVFARDVAGAALLAQCLFGFDENDSATRAVAPADLLTSSRQPPPILPTFAFVKTPWWDRTDETTRSAWSELVDALGDQVFEVELPEPFPQALSVRQTINEAEMARNYARYARNSDQLSPEMNEALERGRATLAHDYMAALDWAGVMRAGLSPIFERCDAIICPAANGAAPTPDTTGDAAFAALWTLVGAPAITLPLMADEADRPLGLQMVARPGDDARLMRNANWMTNFVTGEDR